MLFCHSQPESFHQHSASYIREALAPFLKNEEARLMAEHAGRRSPFQYVLCAATSPAVKQQEESLTYLNQGQSYEIRMLNRKLVEYTDRSSKHVKSIVRVVFHERRLQYVEHQQLEGWRWNRPGDRILDIDIPLSVGILEPCSHPLHLNTIEFLWDPAKNTSVFIQVNCISTEFTPRKHGGEKGVPFRIQVDTFTTNEHGEYVEHVDSASCQVKVFKPKGADRKLKTDREKIDKKSLQDREKYQVSNDTTLLKECSPWPDALSVMGHSSSSSSSSSTPSPVYHNSPTSCGFTDGNCSPNQQDPPAAGCSDHLLPSSSPQDTQQWLHRHRFSPFSRLFSSFSGADLLRMSRDDLIQICGPADGIRLFNMVKGRLPEPQGYSYCTWTYWVLKRILGDGSRDNEYCYILKLAVAMPVLQLYAEVIKTTGQRCNYVCSPPTGQEWNYKLRYMCIQPRLTIYVCQQQTRHQTAIKPVGGDIYQALYLEELTLLDLSEKIALLYSIAPQQITHIYRQKPNGIHVLVSDEVVQSFKDEMTFILSMIRDENTDGCHVVLK